MSNLPSQSLPVYATDEDIAVRAGGDFTALTPAWQSMASGTDGTFAANGWVLTSTAVNFATNGVQPNHVVRLTGGTPKGSFLGGGQLLAVDSVSANTITLRRLHKDLNDGHPPAPAGGLTAVTFAINTLDPQIEEASFDIKQRFSIDELAVGKTSTSIYDLRDLRIATVLSVLYDRYTAEARTEKGDWSMKIQTIGAQLGTVLDRVRIRWGTTGNVVDTPPVFNQTRLSR